MKKVLFLIGNLSNAGGTEKVTSLIANQLSERGFDVTILSLVDGLTPFFPLSEKIKIASLYSEKISFKKNFLSAVFKLRKFVQLNQVTDLIVVDSISCIFSIPALIGLKVNHICWEHFNFLNNNGTRLREYGRILAARYCHTVITLTERDKVLWQNRIRKINADIVAIPNPIAQITEKNLPQYSYKTVLSVGRLVHVKGFDLLLEAWKMVNKEYPDWKLSIVGGGEEEANLKQISLSLGLNNSVSFIGASDNVASFYKKSSFYCLSSRFEGFPMVLLEAQSYGLPIVAFNCETGPAEIVENNISGYLVRPEDVNDLSDKILKLIKLSEDQFLNMCNSSKINSEKYSFNSIMPQWISVLNKS